MKLGFIYLFMLMMFKGIPTSWTDLFEIVGVAAGLAVFIILSDFFSLRRSYLKNKNL
ncbi:hypothetical protein JNUCC74_12360 [Cerasibacillus sp. JNUCC 74]